MLRCMRLDDLLRGPHPRLPRPLDALSERWAVLRPRTRGLTVATCAVLAVLAVDARVRAAESRWGGAAVTVLIAERDLPVGSPVADLASRRLPPAAVPPGALHRAPDGAVLAFALPRGSVLTRTHVHPRGPAAGLAPGLRAVPVPAEEGWGVTAGGWVDVWVLGAGNRPARLVARSRPVLEVRQYGTAPTALVGLDASEVGPTSAGLALGRVLLAHAPPPLDG